MQGRGIGCRSLWCCVYSLPAKEEEEKRWGAGAGKEGSPKANKNQKNRRFGVRSTYRISEWFPKKKKKKKNKVPIFFHYEGMIARVLARREGSSRRGGGSSSISIVVAWGIGGG